MKKDLEARMHELPIADYNRLADSISGQNYQACQIQGGRKGGNDCINFVAYFAIQYSLQHGYPEYCESPAVRLEIELGFFHANNNRYWPAIYISYAEPMKGNQWTFVVSKNKVLYPAEHSDIKPEDILKLFEKRIRFVSGMYDDDFMTSSLHYVEMLQGNVMLQNHAMVQTITAPLMQNYHLVPHVMMGFSVQQQIIAMEVEIVFC